jgi:hypothetical protein
MTILNADRWLYSQLTTDPQLSSLLNGRVYVDIAPASTQYPMVVISLVSSGQTSNFSSDKVMDNELWQVAIWTDQPSYLYIEGIADRIRELLHKSSGTGVIGAVYEGSRRMYEQEGNLSYKGIILEFRLFIQ